MSYTRRRYRKSSFLEGVTIFIGAMVLIAALNFFEAWAVMLLIGAAHSYESAIPALGFWATFFLSWALSIVTYHRYSNSDKD